jgi:iduronate 2-sulfatase
MKALSVRLLIALFLGLALHPLAACAEERPNILLICIDDLRPELACFGVDYIHSPNIDQLASQSRIFKRHYVQAPTCGASRFALLMGRYGNASNDAIFQLARAASRDRTAAIPMSMPGWFRQHGYSTVSVGKVSHHPGGRGGADWDDDAQPEMPDAWDRHLLPAGDWQHPRGAMHGLARGEIRNNVGAMDVFQSVSGDDSIYPDGLIAEEALHQLDMLSRDNEKPFFLAVGIIRPHLPFGAPAEYMTHYSDAVLPPTPHPFKPSGKTTWHASSEFMKYNRWGRDPNQDAEFAIAVRKHYAACVTYADAQVGKLLQRLRDQGRDQDTIVLLWGDHGWHLGEHAIWGKHSLFEESLRSPLLIRAPNVQQPGEASESIVETLDIFPTLCELTGLPQPSSLDGVSLVPMLLSSKHAGHAAISYTAKAKTIRTDTHRLILHNDGFAELYEHRLAEEENVDAEAMNIAKERPAIVAELSAILNQRVRKN